MEKINLHILCSHCSVVFIVIYRLPINHLSLLTVGGHTYVLKRHTLFECYSNIITPFVTASVQEYYHAQYFLSPQPPNSQ